MWVISNQLMGIMINQLTTGGHHLVDMEVSINGRKVPKNGWFIVENPIKRDDLGLPLFQETSISSGKPSICY